MEKSDKPSTRKAAAGKARSAGAAPHPHGLFSSSVESTPAPVSDAPDTRILPVAFGIEAKLVVEKGVHAGKVLKLGAGTAIIGRSSRCELSLKGASGVSRRHCKVQLIGKQYAIIDLESRNGTIVNGTPHSRMLLKDGDVIEVCDEVLRFVSSGGPPTSDANDAAPGAGADDINERATQLLSPEARGMIEPSPAATRQMRPRARDDSDEGSDEGPAAAPPPLPPSLPPMAADRTASFVMPSFEPARADRTLEASEAAVRPPPLGASERELSTAGVPERAERARRGGVRVLLVLLVAAVVVLGAAGWDLTVGPHRLATALAALRQRLGEAPPAARAPEVPAEAALDATPPPTPATAPTDAPLAPELPTQAAATATAPPADAPAAASATAPGDAGDAPSIPATATDTSGATAAAAQPDSPAAAAPTVATGTALEVTASVGGTVSRLSARAGQHLNKGQPLAVLEGGTSALRKKLDSLQDERRDFQSAADKGVASARRDLVAVEREIGVLERRLRVQPLLASAPGTVLELRVKVGSVVKAGDVIAVLKPD